MGLVGLLFVGALAGMDQAEGTTKKDTPSSKELSQYVKSLSLEHRLCIFLPQDEEPTDEHRRAFILALPKIFLTKEQNSSITGTEKRINQAIKNLVEYYNNEAKQENKDDFVLLCPESNESTADHSLNSNGAIIEPIIEPEVEIIKNAQQPNSRRNSVNAKAPNPLFLKKKNSQPTLPRQSTPAEEQAYRNGIKKGALYVLGGVAVVGTVAAGTYYYFNRQSHS